MSLALDDILNESSSNKSSSSSSSSSKKSSNSKSDKQATPKEGKPEDSKASPAEEQAVIQEDDSKSKEEKKEEERPKDAEQSQRVADSPAVGDQEGDQQQRLQDGKSAGEGQIPEKELSLDQESGKSDKSNKNGFSAEGEELAPQIQKSSNSSLQFGEQKDAVEELNPKSSSRRGSLISDELQRAKSRDDTELLGILDSISKDGSSSLEFDMNKDQIRGQRKTLVNVKTFSTPATLSESGVVPSPCEEQIFADNVDINQITTPTKQQSEKESSSSQKSGSGSASSESSSSSSEKKAPAKKFQEGDEISDEFKQQVMAELDLDDSDDDSSKSSSSSSGSSSSNSNEDSQGVGSFGGDSFHDKMDQSMYSEISCVPEHVDTINYLPFISDKYVYTHDVLEVIDRNERSFKFTAEKMIRKSSQLDKPPTNEDGQDEAISAQRRLMHFKLYESIAYSFHGQANLQSGVPYCIAALEDMIAIGSSDGFIHLFDTKDESQIKAIGTKELKQNAVTCLDMKRIRGSQSLFLVAGHAKGQIALYEVKGLPSAKFQHGGGNQSSRVGSMFGNKITFKNLKVVSDMAQGQLVQVKFFGEFKKESMFINLVSCDINGTVYLSRYLEDVWGYTTNKQCFWKKRLNGPSYVIAPLFYDFEATFYKSIGSSNHSVGNLYQNREFIQKHAIFDDHSDKRNHLIAFGALERVIICKIMPAPPKELFCIERPDYIDPQIVPYLDWGEGLSPVYRDSTYPILAITWGKTVQLAVWTNHQDHGASPILKFDGFYICEGFSIDQCFFLDQSLLFLLVNKKEVRILYTQNFTPGVFDEKLFETKDDLLQFAEKRANQLNSKKDFLKIKDKFTGVVSTYAEVDKGYRLLQKEEIRHKDVISVSHGQLKSKFNFNPTVTKNFDGTVVALGKSTVCQGKLLHWEEYLDLIRRMNPDDWLKVLRAALDIFNGKMVGLAGLPDQRETRELQLKDKMKNLLRQNIDACIKEFQEGMMIQSRTLRVATEFCIKVGAIDHLFGELFSMFAEAGIEQRYFENLEAFILSGKLKETIIPDRILTRIIQYYRQKDVELLEKSILNLNLSRYQSNLEVRHICEEELLSSALIYMLTTIFDKDKNMENTVCLHILCALFSLMHKSKIVRSKEDVIRVLTAQNKIDSTILFEANQLQDKTDDQEIWMESQKTREIQQVQRDEKLQVEHSKTYIGYKLMWVIRLFLEGKKFPTGIMKPFKYCMYVFDIVRFITTPMFLKWLLKFDVQRFFKLILPIFVDEQPFWFIHEQRQFVEMHKEEVPGLEECATHEQILDILSKEISEILENERSQNDHQLTFIGEIIENSYIFFISKVSLKGTDIKINHDLYCSSIRKQLKFHRKLIDMQIDIDNLVTAQRASQIIKPQDLLKAIANQKFIAPPNIEDAHTQKDKSQQLYKHLIYKNEKGLLAMIKAIQEPFDEDLIKEFQKEADLCPLFMVRVYLHQILGNYQKCLTLFFRIKVIKFNVFGWLQDIQSDIMMHKTQDDNLNQNTFKAMQDCILKNISNLIQMDPNSTIILTDQWFHGDYQEIVEAIEKYNEKTQANSLCFNFITAVLEMKKQTITDEYMQKLVTGVSDKGPSVKYTKLILKLVRILCEKKFRKYALDYMQKDYFPIDECLEICEDKGVQDACAILYRRKGEYERSIFLYVEVLTKLSKDKIISALFVDTNIRPFNDPLTKNQDIKRFDELMTMIIEICDQCGNKLLKVQDAEKLWLYSVENIYQVRQAVMVSQEAQHDEGDLDNFQKFLMSRIQAFMMKMAEYVQLEKIINFLENNNLSNTYQEFQPTFEEKVKRETYHEKILNNAADLINKDVIAECNILHASRAQGVVAKQLKCDHCEMAFVTKWDHQKVEMFKCGHNFHSRCVQITNYNCSKCFNKYDNIQNIIQSRQSSQKPGVGIRRSSLSRDFGRSPTKVPAPTPDSDSDEQTHGDLADMSSYYGDYAASSDESEENSDAAKYQRQNLLFEMAMSQKQMFYHQFQ